MAKEIKIGSKFIGQDGGVFIIAEAGVNHDGNFNVAKDMVSVAAQSAADAVTFQHIVNSELNVSQPCPKKLDWSKWLLKDEEMRILFSLAKKKGLLCTACVIDNKSVDKIINYGADFFKIVSGDITNIPFLRYCAKKKLPLFISTGAASLGEIEAAIQAIKSEGNDKIVLYHTNTNYPTPPQEINLNVLMTLKAAFGEITGFCDHTEDSLASIAAVVLGVKVIEKHFTLDKSRKGPDYQVSLEPDELKKMVAQIRSIEKIMGSPIKRLLESERTYILARRSIVTNKNILKGERIKESMLAFKRPGTGISPALIDCVLGCKVRMNIAKDSIISWDMLF